MDWVAPNQKPRWISLVQVGVPARSAHSALYSGGLPAHSVRSAPYRPTLTPFSAPSSPQSASLFSPLSLASGHSFTGRRARYLFAPVPLPASPPPRLPPAAKHAAHPPNLDPHTPNPTHPTPHTQPHTPNPKRSSTRSPTDSPPWCSIGGERCEKRWSLPEAASLSAESTLCASVGEIQASTTRPTHG